LTPPLFFADHFRRGFFFAGAFFFASGFFAAGFFVVAFAMRLATCTTIARENGNET